MAADPQHPFVSRGGVKLRHALDVFGLDVRGLRCADFGCSTGGFTDCLLQAGAALVTSVDPAYGVLAWKLRNDPRVTVMERTNALHAPIPPPDLRPSVVVIDMGWTPQRLCLPAAARWLTGLPITAGDSPPPSSTILRRPGEPPERSDPGTLQLLPSPQSTRTLSPPYIISLIKPHYEARGDEASRLRGGVLELSDAEAITARVAAEIPSYTSVELQLAGLTRSPIAGSRDSPRGNTEWLVLITLNGHRDNPREAISPAPEHPSSRAPSA